MNTQDIKEQVYEDFIKEVEALKLKADLPAVAVVGELQRALRRVVMDSPRLRFKGYVPQEELG